VAQGDYEIGEKQIIAELAPGSSIVKRGFKAPTRITT
jgi:hypothetical protein